MQTRLVPTSLGAVEVAISGPADGPSVLLFPGGHTTAATPLGAEIYTELGYRVVSFSRPGYGHTDVGDLMATEFVPAVSDVCTGLGIDHVAAVVGVSFGGLQAATVAASLPALVDRLVLHSCAPSTLPYPDSRIEAIGGRVTFAPAVQAATWRAVRALIATDAGLRRMMSPLSTLPVDSWWPTWTQADRASARATFAAMDSGSGFVTDLRQGTADGAPDRRHVFGSIECPTLVTGSRFDGGVRFAHAEDLAGTIPAARLVETGATSHFFWLGPSRDTVRQAVKEFVGT